MGCLGTQNRRQKRKQEKRKEEKEEGGKEREREQTNERKGVHARKDTRRDEVRAGVAGGQGAASGQAGGGPLLPHHPGPPHPPGAWPAGRPHSGPRGGESTTATNPRAERDPGAPGWRPACPWGQGALSGLGRLGAQPLASPGSTAWTHRSAADRQMDGWVDRHGGLGCGRAGGRQPAWEP